MRKNGGLTPLMEALGYHFRDPGLLLLALTHPSAMSAGGKDNQRLEFLGDAVLQLCVSEVLYNRHAEMQEGDLTKLRASLVCEESLAQAAKGLGLGEYLALDHGEASSGGREKPSVLADTMEAVLAAAYLDGGLTAARGICARALDDFTPRAIEQNWKSKLQEREQAKGKPAPVYQVASIEGPPHARVFYVEVTLSDGKRGEGKGTSKKQAEQEAAKAVLGN